MNADEDRYQRNARPGKWGMLKSMNVPAGRTRRNRRQCNALYICSASFRLIPSTRQRSSTVAARHHRVLRMQPSRPRRQLGPTPGCPRVSAAARLGPPRTVAGDRKSVGFVADLLDQVKRGLVGREVRRGSSVGEEQRLRPVFALRTLPPDQQDRLESSSAMTSTAIPAARAHHR